MFRVATEATEFRGICGRSSSLLQRGAENIKLASSRDFCKRYCFLLKAKSCSRSLPLLAEPQQNDSRRVALALLRGGHLGSSGKPASCCDVPSGTKGRYYL